MLLRGAPSAPRARAAAVQSNFLRLFPLLTFAMMLAHADFAGICCNYCYAPVLRLAHPPIPRNLVVSVKPVFVQNPARSQQIPIIKRKLAGTQLAAKLAMSLLMFEDMLLCPIMSHYQISECDGCLRNL